MNDLDAIERDADLLAMAGYGKRLVPPIEDDTVAPSTLGRRAICIIVISIHSVNSDFVLFIRDRVSGRMT